MYGISKTKCKFLLTIVDKNSKNKVGTFKIQAQTKIPVPDWNFRTIRKSQQYIWKLPDNTEILGLYEIPGLFARNVVECRKEMEGGKSTRRKKIP